MTPKSKALHSVSRFDDLLGTFSPTTLNAKLFIQELHVTAGFPVQRYLVLSVRRGGPLRTETTRATAFKPRFILVYWVFTVFSVCTAVLVVFYQGLPVYCFYRTASFLTAPLGNGSTVFVKCSRITEDWRTSGINVEIHARLFMQKQEKDWDKTFRQSQQYWRIEQEVEHKLFCFTYCLWRHRGIFSSSIHLLFSKCQSGDSGDSKARRPSQAT